MSQLSCPSIARVDSNVHHSAVAVLYRTVLFFPSPPVATSLSLEFSLFSFDFPLFSFDFSLFSFGCIFVSLFFCILDDRE